MKWIITEKVKNLKMMNLVTHVHANKTIEAFQQTCIVIHKYIPIAVSFQTREKPPQFRFVDWFNNLGREIIENEKKKHSTEKKENKWYLKVEPCICNLVLTTSKGVGRYAQKPVKYTKIMCVIILEKICFYGGYYHLQEPRRMEKIYLPHLRWHAS